MLLLKYCVVVEKRRKALKLSASDPDPKTVLCDVIINEIMQDWREEFLATDRMQWSLARDKKARRGDEYWVGAPLPDQRIEFPDLKGHQRKYLVGLFEEMLTQHFAILKPGKRTGGDQYLFFEGQRLVKHVLQYGLIYCSFLRTLLEASAKSNAARKEDDITRGGKDAHASLMSDWQQCGIGRYDSPKRINYDDPPFKAFMKRAREFKL